MRRGIEKRDGQRCSEPVGLWTATTNREEIKRVAWDAIGNFATQGFGTARFTEDLSCTAECWPALPQAYSSTIGASHTNILSLTYLIQIDIEALGEGSRGRKVARNQRRVFTVQGAARPAREYSSHAGYECWAGCESAGANYTVLGHKVHDSSTLPPLPPGDTWTQWSADTLTSDRHFRNGRKRLGPNHFELGRVHAARSHLDGKYEWCKVSLASRAGAPHS